MALEGSIARRQFETRGNAMSAIRRSVLGALAAVIAGTLPLHGSLAQAAPTPAPEPDIWHRDALFGDWGGLRSDAADRGLTLGATYIGETLANVHGGIRRDGIYEGRLEFTVDADLAKIAGWQDARAHAGFYQIHGRGISGQDVGSLVTVSGIEARPSTRLFTLWIEQSLLDDKVSVRAGKIAADDEFLISDTAGVFIINSFGWTSWTSLDLLNGGPIYPLAGPGVRIKVQPSEQLSLLSAVFSGDQIGRAHV